MAIVPMQAGTLLKDRYLIVRELSSGGFGKVFLAHDQQLHNRPVVVKIQLDRRIDDPWFEKKFAEEVRALAMIDHPGVVGALDSARTEDGRPFLVMQYVEGQPLRSIITADGLPLDRAANIIRQIGHALGAAHSKKIWHRDLKPENIMLQVLPGGDEHVRLIDFGLATIADLAAKNTQTRIAGSVAYMAPEQFTGQPSASTDIYAFGVIAYEIVTGRKPFVAEDALQLNTLQRSGVRVKPSALRPAISSTAEKLILNSISYNPNDRPASASGFGDALGQALLSSQSTQTIQIQMEASKTRRVRLMWLAVALAVVLACGAAWICRGRIFPAQPAIVRQATPAAVPTAVLTSSPSAADAAVEIAFWNSIGTSSDPRLYREYLAQYPNGRFAALAKLKLEEKPSKAAANPAPPQASTVSVQSPQESAEPLRAVMEDLAVWKSIGTSSDPQRYREYLAKYPNGKFAALAKFRLETLPLKGPETHLSPQAGSVPPVRPALKPDEYGGPLRGELRWAGLLQPGGTLIIQGGKAISGDLTGDLPRVPSTVEALTSNVAVVEEPSAANQWDRVVVKNGSSAPLGSIQIRWRVAR
jgi:tRNA A-37 threonylcarbamoyl transferase component Bud32